MTYLMLYGVGWTQRWQLAETEVDHAIGEIARVGRDETTQVAVLDPGTGAPTTLVVGWRHVATAVLLGSERDATVGEPSSGQYR